MHQRWGKEEQYILGKGTVIVKTTENDSIKLKIHI